MTMINYMRKTSFGLFFYFTFIPVFLSGWGYGSSFEYSVLCWIYALSTIIASTYKIKAAVFLIPKSDKNKVQTMQTMVTEKKTTNEGTSAGVGTSTILHGASSVAAVSAPATSSAAAV